MHINDAVFLEDLCPKFRLGNGENQFRFTGKSCTYCGNHLNQLTMYHEARVAPVHRKNSIVFPVMEITDEMPYIGIDKNL